MFVWSVFQGETYSAELAFGYQSCSGMESHTHSVVAGDRSMDLDPLTLLV